MLVVEKGGFTHRFGVRRALFARRFGLIPLLVRRSQSGAQTTLAALQSGGKPPFQTTSMLTDHKHSSMRISRNYPAEIWNRSAVKLALR